MAKQARAVQTWRSIVDAAASVFDDYGYERAAISEILRRAKVTKGALYFHFASKEAIAQAIMDEQTKTVEFEQEGSPLQSLVDGGQQFAFALRHNAMARAGTRLSIEGVFLGGPHPWGDWIDATARMLELGQERGEVFPQIDPMVSAKIIVASFTGIQRSRRPTPGGPICASRSRRCGATSCRRSLTPVSSPTSSPRAGWISRPRRVRRRSGRSRRPGSPRRPRRPAPIPRRTRAPDRAGRACGAVDPLAARRPATGATRSPRARV